MMRYGLLVLAIVVLAGCGGGGSDHSYVGPAGTSPDLSDVFVYAANSPYQGVLKGCATAATTADLCSMTTLPLLGQEVVSPTVDDVMNRVLVSNQWMGDRFRQVLENLPPDILQLLKSVTAIVIDGDIRPSFYSSQTAAIYLDPSNLWLTNEEKATISQAPDYRSDYGAALQFVPLWRYVLDNDYAYTYYSLTGSETRQLSDILYPTAAVLYHELGHANDFLPPADIPSLDRQWTPRQASEALSGKSVSAGLEAAYPLTSTTWFSLAQVLYFGANPTQNLIALTPATVGEDFASDAATDPYGYADRYEDLAMLFEETMMKYHFDIDRDVAFTSTPPANSDVCSDFVVGWGERDRIGDPAVKKRAEFVASRILPDEDLSAFFADLPAPTLMTAGLDWCQNLVLAPTAQVAAAPSAVARVPKSDQLPPQ
jgi:hypothetical protein